jgi:predicted MFS family arabinose efflux permease
MGRGRTFLLAAIAGTAIANNYTLQPALTDVAARLGVPLSTITLAPTAALIGCTAGFALLLPLVDHVAPHRLIGGQLTVLAAALTLAAAAPGAPLLLAAYLLIGATAGVAAQAGTIAGRHAPPQRRATAVATVAAGMSAGILLGRLAGGALADLLGWRRMLLVCAALALLGALGAARLLPPRRPPSRHGYLATLASLPLLLRRHPPLRRAVAAGGLWYFAFNLVWVTLALALGRPPHSLSPTAIGLYSLAGLLGFAALPLTGRLTDRCAPGTVITAAMLTAASGTALLATGLGSPPVTALGLALFDAGCFAAQAANQSRIITLDPARSGSLSSVYLVLYFVAGAIGTALAGPLLQAVHWQGTALTALAALLAAALVGRGKGRPAGRSRSGTRRARPTRGAAASGGRVPVPQPGTAAPGVRPSPSGRPGG